ncbi:MAG: TlpA family protein disulfide reductase [Acidobacteria bacterium]|nr:TlpA family protein disulfide reductase [Acidobacteriota bacterium]
MANRKLDRILLGLIGVLVVALIVVVAEAIQEKITEVGDRAPDFALTTDDGGRMTRADFGGMVLVLNFWATWCGPCIEELPSLNQFQKQLAGSGVVVLGVSVDRNDRVYRQFLKRAGVTFRTSRDPQADLSSRYGTYKYPETYVIDRNGRVLQKHIGPRNWMDPALLSQIRALL